ncbi:MAG: hypothetical protein KatS3mg079_862 [Caloramator sp.]|nr:MAG: hypothetical protein KatS3mg079_862 [Caloramator sp.]
MRRYKKEIKESNGSLKTFFYNCVEKGYMIEDWPFVAAAYRIYLEDGGEMTDQTEREYEELMAQYGAPSYSSNK